MGVVDTAETPGFITTTLDKLLRWGRSRSMWPCQAGLACCSLEMMTAGSARKSVRVSEPPASATA